MQIITATSPDEFNAALKAHSRLLVDFYKEHCPGCRMLDMALNKFAATRCSRWCGGVEDTFGDDRRGFLS